MLRFLPSQLRLLRPALCGLAQALLCSVAFAQEKPPSADEDAYDSPPVLLALPLPEASENDASAEEVKAANEPPPAAPVQPSGAGAPTGGAHAPAASNAEERARAEHEGAGEDGEEADTHYTVPGDPWGDPRSLDLISLRGLFQTRYTHTWAEASTHERATYVAREDYLARRGDGYAINRLLVRLASDPSRYVGFKAVADLGQLLDDDPEDVVKQAYVNLRPIPGRIEFLVGLFKLPMSIFELDPTSRFELAEIGPANDLLTDLRFAGRDLGVSMMVAPLRKAKRLRLTVGAFRGHAYDENASPIGAVAGRVEVKPIKALRFGADIVEHVQANTYNRPFNTSNRNRLPNPPDPLYPNQKNWGKGRAVSVDATFKKKKVWLRVEGVYGDRLDLDRRYDARTFWAATGVLSYGFDVGSVRFIPAVRAEVFDSDREHAQGMHRTISGGLTARFFKRMRFLLDVTHTEVGANTPLVNQPRPLQETPYLALDNTRFITQLQLEL